MEKFNMIYHKLVKPLILKLVEGIKNMQETTGWLSSKVSLDAPESVADENITSAHCSWKPALFFPDVQKFNVDIEKTMTCDFLWKKGGFRDKAFGRWVKCRCVGRNDCYVSSRHRKEGDEHR